MEDAISKELSGVWLPPVVEWCGLTQANFGECWGWVEDARSLMARTCGREAGCSEEEAWKKGRMKEFCRVYWRVVEGHCEARTVDNGEEFGKVREVIRMAVG